MLHWELFSKTHSEAVAVELPYAFCGFRRWLQMSEVIWEVWYEGGVLRVGFWVILAPFLGEVVVARHVLGCEVTPEEVRWVGVCG